MPRARRRKVKIGRIILIVVLAVVLAVLFWIWNGLRPAGGDSEQEFTVQAGQSNAEIIQELQEDGLLRSETVPGLYAKFAGISPYAGTFLLSSDMNAVEILKTISDPANVVNENLILTVPEGTWAKDIAAKIHTLLPQYSVEEILAYWNDDAVIDALAKDYAFLNPSALENTGLRVKLEGYLFPETYYLTSYSTLEDITRMFLDQFDKVYQENLSAFQSSGLSVEELVTLASIVQFEASNAEDMKKIAEVFYNRMEAGMLLQSSVTVCYALYDEYNSPEDCEINWDLDSPYNTYLYAGLPPGPILNPGKEALEAVLHPDENDYLYFAADIYNVKGEAGKVYYSSTYEEHEQIVQDLNLVLE